MKQRTLLLIGIATAAILASCDHNEDGVKMASATLQFNIPSSIAVEEGEVGLKSVILKNVNTGEEVRPIKVVEPETKAEGDTIPVANPVLEVSVPEGLYNITMDGLFAYKSSGELKKVEVRSYTENVPILSSGDAGQVISIETYMYDSSVANGFVISEIFFVGTETPEHKQYHNDCYFKITNNSDKTLSADGLALLETSIMTNNKLGNMDPNLIDSLVPLRAMYRIPLGSNVNVAPGESLLIVDNARNHTKDNPNSFDESDADFEWYDESTSPTFTDTDNENVPNLEKVYCDTKTIFAPTVQGNRSYALVRLGDDESNQLTVDEYLDAANGHQKSYSYSLNTNAGPIEMTRQTWTVPNKWVLDAVNVAPRLEMQWLVLSPSLDRGFTSISDYPRENKAYGYSVRRKVLSNGKLQDTNDSSLDFEAVKADPHYKFHE